jgi:hypothetical protein
MTKTKKAKLTPPDPKRCQAEWRGGSFMTLGPRQMERCEDPPVVIVKELKPSEKGGQCGAMSLCPACLTKFLAMAQKEGRGADYEFTAVPAS